MFNNTSNSNILKRLSLLNRYFKITRFYSFIKSTAFRGLLIALVYIIFLFVIVTIFSLDRISKLYVIYLYKKNFNSEIFTSEFLNIYLIWNEGIALGLFSLYKDNLYNIENMKELLYLEILIIYERLIY